MTSVILDLACCQIVSDFVERKKQNQTQKTTMKTIIITVSLLIAAITNGYSASQVNIYITAITGPVRANTNAFEAWSTSVVPYYHAHGQVPTNVVTLTQLVLANITQTAAQTNNTVWFLVHVVSKDPAYKFLPSKLSFVGGSSDSSNYLATAASLSSDPNYTYSSRFYGVNWGSGGAGVNDIILSTSADGKISEVPVNEVIFIGAQLNYFMADYSPWIMGFADYSVHGTWTFADGTNSAHASKTLHTKATISSPWISLDVINKTSSVIGAAMGTNTSAILYSSPQMPPTWKVEGAMNDGDTVVLQKDPSQYYFKLVAQ